MKKRIVSCMLAALMIGITVLSPVNAAAAAKEPAGLDELSRSEVEVGSALVDESMSGEAKPEETGGDAELSGNSISENNTELTEETVYSYSGALSLTKPIKSVIASQYRNLYSYGLSYSFYRVAPNTNYPYAAGALSTIHLQKGLESVNLMRSIAGLPSVGHNPTYTAQAQQGAVVLAANNALSNYPSKPSNMSDAFYTTGRAATQKSNIASDTYTIQRGLPWFTLNYIEDKQAANLENVGNRRWILNPKMSSTGFGYAVNTGGRAYTLLYAQDQAATAPNYDFISWPASGNFPKEFCYGDMPWSVTLNPDKFDVYSMNINNVKVSITAPNGRVQNFSAADSQTDRFDATKPYFNISFTGSGVGNAIIFKPGTAAFGKGKPSGIYNVTIRGVKEKSGKAAVISYNVEFFDATNYLGGGDDAAVNEEPVTAFVNRLYSLCFNRQADDEGMVTWKNALINKTKSGAEVAKGFFFSKELENRKLNNSNYVELLYKVMMNRSSDAGGKSYWLAAMDAGMTREGVFKGFAESKEFENLCNTYGITRGMAYVGQGRDRNAGVTRFVSRLYTKALGRTYDVNGLNDWCNRILDKKWSVTDAATTGFFRSREFLNKNLGNEEYIKVLYRTFLDREYDAAGLRYWKNNLNSGAMTREQVLRGFSESAEFKKMMKDYGL